MLILITLACKAKNILVQRTTDRQTERQADRQSDRQRVALVSVAVFLSKFFLLYLYLGIDRDLNGKFGYLVIIVVLNVENSKNLFKIL